MLKYQYIDIIILIILILLSTLVLIFIISFRNKITYPLNKNHKVNIVIYCSVITYIFLLFLLSKAWYGPQSTMSFHFFDDWAEWNYLDKLGHFFTAFHISDIGIRILFWSGLKRKQSLIFGTLLGILFQTPIEIMDGFGLAYGFSWGDIIANICGSLFVCLQYWIWNDIRIIPKFSFHFTNYAAMRPEMLGHNIGQQILKDYNGQTYWFAIDIFKFIKTVKFPFPINIFCLSFGYGAEGMIHGRDNENIHDGFFPFQQYYLSPDINFEKIPAKNRLMQIFFFSINKLHVLMPAIEYSSMYGIKWHFLFF